MLRASSSRGVESRARGTLVIRPYGRLFVAWELFSVLLLFLYAASAALWFGEDNAVKTNHRACMDRSPAFASAGRIHDAVEPPILYSSAPPKRGEEAYLRPKSSKESDIGSDDNEAA